MSLTPTSTLRAGKYFSFCVTWSVAHGENIPRCGIWSVRGQRHRFGQTKKQAFGKLTTDGTIQDPLTFSDLLPSLIFQVTPLGHS